MATKIIVVHPHLSVQVYKQEVSSLLVQGFIQGVGKDGCPPSNSFPPRDEGIIIIVCNSTYYVQLS